MILPRWTKTQKDAPNTASTHVGTTDMIYASTSHVYGNVYRCIQPLEEKQQLKNEAEALLGEGIACFEQQQYDLAKIKFEKALMLFTELGDEEKIEECKEWITSCEEKEKEERGFCMGSVLIIIILLGGRILHNAFKPHRKRK